MSDRSAGGISFSASFLRNTAGQYGGQEQDQETRFHHAMNFEIVQSVHPSVEKFELVRMVLYQFIYKMSFLAWKMAA